MNERAWLLSGSVLSKREEPEEVVITYYDTPRGKMARENRSRFSSHVRHEPPRNHGLSRPMSGGLNLYPAIPVSLARRTARLLFPHPSKGLELAGLPPVVVHHRRGPIPASWF